MHTNFKQTATQKRARVFSNNESFIFYCHNSTSFESVLCMKTVWKIFEKKKIADTLLLFSWLATYQWKKIIEKFNSVGAGAHKLGNSSYRYLESVKKVNYIHWERLVLVHLKRYYKNMYITALLCFFDTFLFCFKGYSETLRRT